MSVQKILTWAGALAAVIGAPAAVAQQSGTISFDGKVTAASCEIVGEGADQTVTLPTVSVNALPAEGATAGETPFDIQLANCSLAHSTHTQTGSQSVTAYFTPNANVNTAFGTLLNTTDAASGGAQNVTIQLLNGETDQPIDIGNTVPTDESSLGNLPAGQFDADNNQVTLNYLARYFATGQSTAGDVNATASYVLIYP
ncbi:MAG: F17 fimbrial protein [Xanthomonadales bacterium]|nr:F17 fimbrial protein [Xanthomonadales bacterium]|tara:strand:+ start:277 stop:873 length:597 start_codon:yes stop_codon:yes gene_type:complete